MSTSSSSESASSLQTQFDLHEVLGEGSQGKTYRAIERETGREVAVKILEFQTFEEWKSVELFEREAEALESIDHPKIPDYIDAHHEFDGESEQFYLAQEYIEGTDLKSLLEAGETFEAEEGRAFVREMLEILDYLHESFSPPIVHRDIKPSNVLRREDGELALIDFGAVQTVLPDETGGSTFLSMGTTGYMPPEQVKGKAGPTSDIYAVAMTAVHMMSGIHPTDIPMDGLEVPLGEIVEVSDDFRAVLARMLAPNVDDRYPDAATALEALDDLEEDVSADEDGPFEPGVEGDEHLKYPEARPGSARSRVKITPERFDIECAPLEPQWLVFVSTLVNTVALSLPFVIITLGCFVPDLVWEHLGSYPPGSRAICLAIILAVVYSMGGAAWTRYIRQWPRLINPRRERLVAGNEFVRVETQTSGDESWSTVWRVPTQEVFQFEVGSDESMARLSCDVRSKQMNRTFGDRGHYVMGWLIGGLSKSLTGRSPVRRDDDWKRELEWLESELNTWIDGRRYGSD